MCRIIKQMIMVIGDICRRHNETITHKSQYVLYYSQQPNFVNWWPRSKDQGLVVLNFRIFVFLKKTKKNDDGQKKSCPVLVRKTKKRPFFDRSRSGTITPGQDIEGCQRDIIKYYVPMTPF